MVNCPLSGHILFRHNVPPVELRTKQDGQHQSIGIHLSDSHSGDACGVGLHGREDNILYVYGICTYDTRYLHIRKRMIHVGAKPGQHVP